MLVNDCFWKDCRNYRFFFVNNRHNSWNCNFIFFILHSKWQINTRFFVFTKNLNPNKTVVVKYHWNNLYFEFHTPVGIIHKINLDLKCSHWYNEILVKKKDIECLTFVTDVFIKLAHVNWDTTNRNQLRMTKPFIRDEIEFLKRVFLVTCNFSRYYFYSLTTVPNHNRKNRKMSIAGRAKAVRMWVSELRITLSSFRSNCFLVIVVVLN